MLDLWTFIVFGIVIALFVVVLVKLGPLPGQLAKKREHPQADAVMVAGWVGFFAGFVGWGLALVWALYRPGATTKADAAGVVGDAKSAEPIATREHTLAEAIRRIAELESQVARLTAGGEGAAS